MIGQPNLDSGGKVFFPSSFENAARLPIVIPRLHNSHLIAKDMHEMATSPRTDENEDRLIAAVGLFNREIISILPQKGDRFSVRYHMFVTQHRNSFLSINMYNIVNMNNPIFQTSQLQMSQKIRNALLPLLLVM